MADKNLYDLWCKAVRESRYTEDMASAPRMRNGDFQLASDGSRLVGVSLSPGLSSVVTYLSKRVPGVTKAHVGAALMNAVEDIALGYLEDHPQKRREAHSWKCLGSRVQTRELRAALDSVICCLQATVHTHDVILPIYGLSLKGITELEIGPVVLRPVGEVTRAVDSLSANLGQSMASLANQAWGQADCVARVRCVGDDDFAVEAGRVLAEKALSIVIYCWRAVVPVVPPISLGATGDPGVQSLVYGRAGELINDKGLILSVKLPGRRKAFIDEQGRGRLVDGGLAYLAQSLSEAETTSVLSRLGRAVNWYARAVQGRWPSESYLEYWIALESLLTTGRECITKTLKRRIARALCADPSSVRAMERRVAELYDVRSRVAHAGTVVESNDVNEVDRIARGCIGSLASGQFADENSMFEWLDREV